jgi:hypothetical protein
MFELWFFYIWVHGVVGNETTSVCKPIFHSQTLRNEIVKVLQTFFSFPKVANSLIEYSTSR